MGLDLFLGGAACLRPFETWGAMNLASVSYFGGVSSG